MVSYEWLSPIPRTWPNLFCDIYLVDLYKKINIIENKHVHLIQTFDVMWFTARK